MSEIAKMNYMAGMKLQPIRVIGQSRTCTVLGAGDIIPLEDWKCIHVFFLSVVS
jgi:hypothetical protein